MSLQQIYCTGSWIRETIAPSKVAIEIYELDFFACDLQRDKFQNFLKYVALNSTRSDEYVLFECTQSRSGAMPFSTWRSAGKICFHWASKTPKLLKTYLYKKCRHNLTLFYSVGYTMHFHPTYVPRKVKTGTTPMLYPAQFPLAGSQRSREALQTFFDNFRITKQAGHPEYLWRWCGFRLQARCGFQLQERVFLLERFEEMPRGTDIIHEDLGNLCS